MGSRDETMVDLSGLGPIPRILFATDGAITHILEAYAGEPVELVTASSRIAEASELPGAAMAEDERALQRITLLRGTTSRRAFVHGEVIVILDRLPAPVADDLVRTGRGLLDVLTTHRIGTFRETVDEWEGEDEVIAARFHLPARQSLVGRTYQVVVAGRPVAWVTERFPRDGFSSPAGATPGPGAVSSR